MGVAIVLGIIAGFVGFLALFVALRLSRRSTSTSPLNAGLYGLGGSCVSLLIVAIALIVCAITARDLVLPFAIAEIVVLVAATSIYVVHKNALAKKRIKK